MADDDRTLGILIRDAEKSVVWMDETYQSALDTHASFDAGEIRIGDRWFAHREQPITSGPWQGGRVAILFDVTEMKQLTDSLRAAEIGLWSWNIDTNELSVDTMMERILGYDAHEVSATPEGWDKLVHPDDRPMLWNASAEHIAGRTSRYEVAHRMLHKDGSVRWFLSRGSVVRDARGRPHRMVGTHTNITDQKATEQNLRNSLEEKETLLTEVHHRVKNNLQIISSLLSMQARQLDEEDARSIVLESQNRIRSMAMVHEMLYASEGLAKIDFGEYVSKLADSLRAAHGAKAANVEVTIEVDGVVLDLDTAVHLGLILNELISNAFKHAFQQRSKGHLGIRLDQNQNGIHLTVSDDGVGLPSGFDLETAGTLGVQLVRAVSSQLGATTRFETDGGTVVRISVPRLGG